MELDIVDQLLVCLLNPPASCRYQETVANIQDLAATIIAAVDGVATGVDFSHPSRLSVNHPVRPVIEGLSQGDGERLVPVPGRVTRAGFGLDGARYAL
jgi:hypothetical protein